MCSLRRQLVMVVGLLLVMTGVLLMISVTHAQNVASYSDTISDSRPEAAANHTFRFRPRTNIAPGGSIRIDFPNDFVVADENFGTRNVELYVDSIVRNAADSVGANVDGVSIVSGPGGSVEYELHAGAGISAESSVELLLGNHTSGAILSETTFSTTTGTTTTYLDAPPITNSATTGTHKIPMVVNGAEKPITAEFSIAVVRSIQAGPADTTETDPPFRFNGTPTSTVGGTTQFVEISVETDEFAFCRYSTVPDVDFNAMSNEFDDTGIIFHTSIVPVTRGELNTFYVRCIDDEDNFNIDDYLVAFSVQDEPTGQANTEGETSGDGTGTGDSGTGDGAGSGGTTGERDGEASTTGGSSGGGGSGGGGGGGAGGDTGAGGGGSTTGEGPFESGNATVIISGTAPSRSEVVVLVDGQQAETTRASTNGSFSITFSDISRGVYTFGLYAEDSDGNRSSTFSTSFTVSGNRTSNLSNISIAPTLRISPDPVDIGSVVTMSGVSVPEANIVLENQRKGTAVSRQTHTTVADANGAWELEISTAGFRQDTYEARVRADVESAARTPAFSEFIPYGVGQAADVPLNADLNQDSRVNLTDFSILLFWWDTAGGDSNPPADINRDGRVNLTDFSILLFNWTG